MKRRIANWLLKHLFNTFTIDDILQRTNNGYRIGDRELNKQMVKALRQEARMIKKTELYPLLVRELKVRANKDMYERSKNSDDIMFGKATLHTIDILEKLIDKLAK